MIAIDVAPPTDVSRMSWVWRSKSLRAAGLCLLTYAAVAVTIAPGAYGAFLNHYARALSYFMPILIIPICALGLVAWWRGTPRETIAAHLIGRLPLIALLAAALLLAFSSYTTIKFSIPSIVPFYADAWSANFDASLHFGDPWRWAHAIWPDAWSGFLFICYNYAWFFYWFGTPVFVLLWLPRQQVKRYLWSLLLTFIVCGSVLALAFSSVGPVFYADFLGDGRFEPLTDRLAVLEGMNEVLAYAAYLYDSYQSQDTVFGTGISAIPSMHVAVVTLNAWLFSSLNRWAGTLAWSFAAIIMFTSVYTGWHYAIDGYLSFLAVTAVWFGVRRAHGEALYWPRGAVPFRASKAA